MRIPGMNYQDGRSWPVIKKAIAHSLEKGFVGARLDKNSPPDVLQGRREEIWVQAGELLRRNRDLKRISEEHGRDYMLLASELLDQLFLDPGASKPRARQSAWIRLVNMLPGKGVRTACTNVITEVRDRLDINGYMATTEDEWPPWPKKWRMTTYRFDKLRTIDTCINGLERLFANWRDNLKAVEDILGHPIYAAAEPIEIRAFRSNGTCNAIWLMRWSERWGPSRRDKNGEVVWRHLHGGHMTNRVWAMQDLERDINDVIAQLSREAKRAEECGETGTIQTGHNNPGSPPDDDWLPQVYESVNDVVGGDRVFDEPKETVGEGLDEYADNDGDGNDGDETILDDEQEFSIADSDEFSPDDFVAPANDDEGLSDNDMDLPEADGEGVEALVEKCLDSYPPAILGYMVLDLANWNIDRVRDRLKKKRVFELLGIPEYIAKLSPGTYLKYVVDGNATETDRDQRVRQLTAEVKLATVEVMGRWREASSGSGSMKSGEKR